MDNKESASIVDKVKELVAKGNVSRVVVRRGEQEILNISVNAGIVGGAVALMAAKWVLLAGVLATVGFGCTVAVVKDNGEEVDVLKEGDVRKVKETATSVVKDVKEAVMGKVEVVEENFEEVVSQDEPAEEPEEEKAEENGPGNEG